MKTAKTELLEIAYLDNGPQHQWPVLLLHGWLNDLLEYDRTHRRDI